MRKNIKRIYGEYIVNIESMKDGKYILLELEGCFDEFEIEVKNGNHTINRNNYGIITPVDNKEHSLLCDLHESENWEKEEDL